MHKRIMRLSVVAVAAATLSTLEVAGLSISGADAGTGHPARASSAGTIHAAAVPGTQLWAARYNGDGAGSVAVSPDGGKVFITGRSLLVNGTYYYATVAYSAATGAQLWAARYGGPGTGLNEAHSVVVSLDGRRVFVTGESAGTTTSLDYATVAYDAATGAQLWAARYDGPAHQSDWAQSVAVSPDGRKVFVTGMSFTGDTTDYDYATIAYNAATGAKLWIKRYNGTANGSDGASAVAVSPDGGMVFVTGTAVDTGAGPDYTTVAYSAATGAQLWLERYDGANLSDYGIALTVGPAGTVYVTGESQSTAGNPATDYATVAYLPATGAQVWVARYTPPGGGEGRPSSMAVSPTGSTVFVTGGSATVAYDTHTGALVWADIYGRGAAVAVSRDGTKVFVAGASQGAFTGSDYATRAYSSATGAQLWLRRYTGPGDGDDYATSVAVSPTASKVFVTGHSPGWPGGSGGATATVAYSG